MYISAHQMVNDTAWRTCAAVLHGATGIRDRLSGLRGLSWEEPQTKVETMARGLRILLAGVLGAGVALGMAPTAYAASADQVDIQAKLTRDAVLTVTQTITVSDTSDVPNLTVQIPARMDRDQQRYTFEISDIQVSADGASLAASMTKSKGEWRVSFDTTTAADYQLSYTATGSTTTAVDGRVDFTWLLLGGLNIDTARVTGTLEVPPGAVNYDCQAGTPGALLTCSTYGGGTHGETAMDFTQNLLSSGQVLQAEVTFPTDAITVTESVSPIWTLGRAFTPGWPQIGAMICVLVVGGLALFGLWRRVHTHGYRGIPVSVAKFSDDNGKLTFETDPAARPGMIGTLMDFRVDPADIVATILDLAVRGHLRITEVQTSRYATADWTFTRLSAPDGMNSYETHLLDALTSQNTSVSGLSAGITQAVVKVQAGLYEQVRSVGWFSRLPSDRSPMVGWAWGCVGIAVAAACALTGLTTFGLAGLSLIALSVIGVAIAYQDTPVTPTGAAVQAGLRDLSQQLRTHTGAEIDPGERYAQISSILPYAVVLGGWDQWLASLVASDEDAEADSIDLDWYHAPSDWHMADLPASLDAFITIVTGRLFARS